MRLIIRAQSWNIINRKEELYSQKMTRDDVDYKIFSWPITSIDGQTHSSEKKKAESEPPPLKSHQQ